MTPSAPRPVRAASTVETAEHRRLAEATGRAEEDLFDANPWYEWGPYLSERAWGTVREDYSADGNAWDYFPHDHARSRAYRWNEDGMAGLSDIHHDLCLSLALWNGRDPILKERMFGLTGPQGNHGEDTKEYWWYSDALPSHALLHWRYHYPQQEFPYRRLIEENARRSRDEPEFELSDTGIFDADEFWVVEVTYAKANPAEVLMRIRVENRGPEAAELSVLPTLWFRNTWRIAGEDPPALGLLDGDIVVRHPRLDGYRLQAAAGPDGVSPTPLFCDNETNAPRVFGSAPITEYPKDGINDHVVSGAPTVNPDRTGTKAAWWYRLAVPAHGSAELRLRLSRPGSDDGPNASGIDWHAAAFDKTVTTRERETDEFYAAIAPADIDPERMRVLRQSCAGLIWSKQMYPYRVNRWLDGDPGQMPPPDAHRSGRNAGWRHLDALDVMAMPDAWEYPWFAAWDLAFHTIPWAHLDPAFAKYQLLVLLREWFQHPNGAIPAYEWSFDDVNPPVHALAALRVFVIDGSADRDFLSRVFQKLLLNFTWWLNRLDPDGNNLFGGGFLGLDNISPIDRSHLPPGVTLDQADGTAWMAYYSIAMLAIAVTLAQEDAAYEDMVVKFLEQTVQIMDALEDSGTYDEADGFFYDRLSAGGATELIKVRTLVGIIPALPAISLPLRDTDRIQRLRKRFARRLEQAGRHKLLDWHVRADGDIRQVLLSVVPPGRLAKVYAALFDESEFLSPHGLRSLSRRHTDPYTVPGMPDATIDYQPAESRTPMYGGNSNWRGPVWFPINYLVIRALLQYDRFFGSEFTVEYPTGSGARHSLREVAGDLADRLIGIWLPGPDGRRPVNGSDRAFDAGPVWSDNLLFYEYFNGDTGAGLGAAHQTGWTALVADLLLDPPRASRRMLGDQRPGVARP